MIVFFRLLCKIYLDFQIISFFSFYDHLCTFHQPRKMYSKLCHECYSDNLFIHLFIYSLIYLFIYSFLSLFIYQFIYLFIYLFIHSFNFSNNVLDWLNEATYRVLLLNQTNYLTEIFCSIHVNSSSRSSRVVRVAVVVVLLYF